MSVLDSVLPIFEVAGVQVVTLLTDYAGHAGDYVRNEELLDAFVGIGGDGTAHEIASAMMNRPVKDRVPIGIIPAGSGNTWAYDLGLEDAVSAAEAVVRGGTTAIDVMSIEVDHEAAVESPLIAINICGFGMPAAVLEQANSLRWLGSAQYELAGLVLIALGKTRFGATLEVENVDGSILTRELDDCSFVQAHNNMHMGKKVAFAPEARMDDGLIDLVLVKRSGGLDILHANALARGATHVNLPFVEVLRCRSYKLTPRATSSSGAAAAINLDGELEEMTRPFRVSCLPRSLEVCAVPPLREVPRDTSSDLEPQLVMSLVNLLESD